MFARIPEKYMHLTRWGLAIGWLILIASMFYTAEATVYRPIAALKPRLLNPLLPPNPIAALAMQNYHEESFGAPKKVKAQKPESVGNPSVAGSIASSVASVATPDRPAPPPVSAPSPSAGTSLPVVVFSQSQ